LRRFSRLPAYLPAPAAFPVNALIVIADRSGAQPQPAPQPSDNPPEHFLLPSPNAALALDQHRLRHFPTVEFLSPRVPDREAAARPLTPQWRSPIWNAMAIREIIKLPAPLLKKVSKPVPAVTPEITALLDDMLETMYAAPGIGLAAVQIGIPKRLVVVDVVREDDKPKNPLFFINPEIVWSSEELREHEEGCLSIPEVFDMVKRPAEVKVRYLDREGRVQEMHCTDLLATCIQHEIDHLNGVLFIDRLSRLKRDRVVKKFSKSARREKAEA
jgi:peptide deformylase